MLVIRRGGLDSTLQMVSRVLWHSTAPPRVLLVAVQESGSAAPSSSFIEDRAGLRVALTNHRTRDSDLDYFVDETLRLAAELGGVAV